jgi:hypothetical protein
MDATEMDGDIEVELTGPFSTFTQNPRFTKSALRRDILLWLDPERRRSAKSSAVFKRHFPFMKRSQLGALENIGAPNGAEVVVQHAPKLHPLDCQ